MSQPFNAGDNAPPWSEPNGSHPSGTNANGANANGTNAASVNGASGASLNSAGSGLGFEARAGLSSGSPVVGLERAAAPAPGYPRAPLGSDDDEETVDLSRPWRALKRRRGLVLKTFGAVLLLGTLWTLLQKPIYQSTAIILVSTPGGGGGGMNAGLSGIFGGITTSPSLGQQMVIIRSPNVQKGALALLKPVQKEEVQRFSRSDIAPEPGADAIDVQTQAHTPEAAATFANAICNAYINQSLKQNSDQIIARTRDIAKKLEDAKGQLNLASQRVQRFGERYNIADLSAETTASIAQLEQNEADLRTNETARRADERALQVVKQQLQGQPPFKPSAIVPTAVIETLKAKLNQLKIDRAALTPEYRSTSREVRNIDKQIQDIQNQINRAPKTQFGALAPNPLYGSLQQQQQDLQNRIEASKTRSQSLQRDIQLARAAKAKLPERAYDLSRLTDDQAQARNLVNTLSQNLQTLSVNEIGRATTAQISTPADPTQSPLIAPRRLFNIAASALLGLVLGALLALLLDRFDDRVHGTDEAEDAARLPVLVHVPLVERRGAVLLLSANGGATQNPALVESFRMLRANITFAGLDEPPRTVAVTSSRAGEGKSTSALNLAVIVALSGKSVLLVDCDLRRPEVHALLGLPNEVGLTTVAAGMSSLEGAIQETQVPGLRVLTSGPIPSNAPELFGSRGGRATLFAASQKAEFVVLDCPPALGLADAHLVASQADATLLVVECEATQKREVARVARSLSQAGARLLGIVLNKTPVTSGENQDYFQLTTLNGATGLLAPSARSVSSTSTPHSTSASIATSTEAGESVAANGSGASGQKG